MIFYITMITSDIHDYVLYMIFYKELSDSSSFKHKLNSDCKMAFRVSSVHLSFLNNCTYLKYQNAIKHLPI